VIYYWNAPEKEMGLADRTAGSLEAALKEVRPLDDGTITRRWTVHVPTYKGTIILHAYIDKDYRLLPTDPAVRKQFEESHENDLVLGNTVATVSGAKYSLAGRKAHPDGKAVVYKIRLDFDASPPFPSVRVVHRIPNIEFNAAKLRNADADLTGDLDREAQAERKLQDAIEDHEHAQKERRAAQDRLSSFQRAAHERAASDAKELLAVEEGRLQEAITKHEATKRQNQEARVREDHMKERIAELQQEIRERERAKAHLALVILRQRGSAELLLRFADYLGGVLTSGRVNKDVFAELREFERAYRDAEAKGMVQLAEADLAAYAKTDPPPSKL